ncbi:tyrosine-type recombinase/integrase [Paenibacillus sp. HN-1]|uniref:tyrosine-type recombinase/integrase n=1 Tax=Paenibacillus TaxID=44249 RepID=UPI001CA86D35|nr:MULTISPECIES: tyrosine-type recombinase/integrase [Paenibacillus]MBY9080974.1 tyrosine-type recombinase/integrase [Paenibacillus sp. CGMCC 1.18879]MBY9083186.1 tyrosine-type recombinase/integrase [Paenibacillus sinensis]
MTKPDLMLADLAIDFEKWLTSENITKQGVRNLLSQFDEIAQFCGDRGIAVPDFSINVAREYLAWLSERPNYHTGKPLAPATRSKHFTCLKRIEQYLKEKKLIVGSMTEGIRRPIPRKKAIQGFSVQQLQAIINAIRDTRASPRYKDRMSLLVFLLASTGVRISEALNLRLDSFDHDRRIILVLGKGDKEREVPFSKDLSDFVQNYADKYNIERGDLLFASRYGKPLAPASVRDALRRTKKSLGTAFEIDRMRVSPHTFRHTFARMWVTKGGNTIALSRILGHTTTQMTSEYVRLWGVDLSQSYDLCDPCGDLKVPKFD